jgi:hypothetical protein
VKARLRLALISALVVGLVGTVAGAGTYAAFFSTASNAADSFAAGTVYVSDDDLGGAVVTMTNGKPSDAPVSGCIIVTYGGSLPADGRLYGSVSGALAPYLTLTVSEGTSSSTFNSCGTFGSATPVYSGALSAFPTTYGTGIASTDPTWTNTETHAYKFVLSVNNTSAAQGLSATATFTWEAQNQ